MGHEKGSGILPKIIRSVYSAGKNVVWTCDPMHGNTIKSNTGFKTRPFKRYNFWNSAIFSNS